MSSDTCRRCKEEGAARPMEWKLRILLSAFAGVIVVCIGLALTIVGIGVPLLVTLPVVILVFLILPWKRCKRCRHIGLG
jgi:hypothetical protein